MRRVKLELCWFSLCLLTGPAALARTQTWPSIQPSHEEHTVVVPSGEVDTPLLTFVKDVVGVPVYRLECHNGYYEGKSEMSFSGDFQCGLFALRNSAVTSANLLAANTRDERSADWWNRGRMLSSQLRGECLAYPEYSTVRNFRVRGMLVTFEFTNVEWSDTKDQQGNPLLAKFTFKLDVVPDKTAQRPTAELALGPKPPTTCYP